MALRVKLIYSGLYFIWEFFKDQLLVWNNLRPNWQRFVPREGIILKKKKSQNNKRETQRRPKNTAAEILKNEKIKNKQQECGYQFK